MKPFTPEQESEARAIVVCKTHYEVLSVSKSADDAEIKKAYRKVRVAHVVACTRFVPCAPWGPAVLVLTARSHISTRYVQHSCA